MKTLINVILKNNFNSGSEKKLRRSENNRYLFNCNKALISLENSGSIIFLEFSRDISGTLLQLNKYLL